ncbi:MAG TPA: alpha/beta hydrolase fold domain-containing protein, partial [Pseudonocardia sp.]|nr:alpha/beta hydrolase fold domain-containing protein [Pseudonocardia sp.]
GFRRTSLAEIAEAVGADRASLYYYFSSKDEILNEAVTPIVLRNTIIAEEIRDADGPAPEKLRRLVTGLMQSFADNFPLLYMYLEEDLSRVTQSQQAWAAEMRAVNRRYVGAVEGIIRRGIAEGTLRPVADPKILANGLMGLVSWTHRWFNPTQSPVDAATIGEAYAQVLVGGLAVAPGESRVGPSWLVDAHPDVARVTAGFDARRVPRYDTLSVPAARAMLEQVVRLQAPETPVAQVRDVLVQGATGQLPARVYHPDPTRRLPLLVYVHGGGWVLGGIGPADRPCRRLAVAGDCVVVSIEYRRAPETKFPGPLEDCLSAVRWLAANAATLGASDDGVVLMGDSAGGNLVAATTRCLSGEDGPRIDRQVLLYPCLAPARTSTFASYTTYADGPLMSRPEMEWFWDHYLRSADDERDPRAAPLLATDLSGLPPTTLVLAELDPLRDEGLAYAERLQAQGVPTQLTVYRGAAHGFWWMDGEMRQAAELTEQLGRQLRADQERRATDAGDS